MIISSEDINKVHRRVEAGCKINYCTTPREADKINDKLLINELPTRDEIYGLIITVNFLTSIVDDFMKITTD